VGSSGIEDRRREGVSMRVRRRSQFACRSTWDPKSGMPNVPVFELQANSKTVVAFTRGCGALQLRRDRVAFWCETSTSERSSPVEEGEVS
jgi:hypothetical protein